MLIALGRVELRIPARSLKEKRRSVRSIVDRARARLDVRVVEVDGLDTWQRAVLGFAVVGNDRTVLQSVTDRVLSLVHSSVEGAVVSEEVRTIAFADLAERGALRL